MYDCERQETALYNAIMHYTEYLFYCQQASMALQGLCKARAWFDKLTTNGLAEALYGFTRFRIGGIFSLMRTVQV